MADPLPELRASDADREHAADVLRRGASEGRLSVDELEERLGSAYAARTRRELDLLMADLGPAPDDRGRGLNVEAEPGGTRWVVAIMGGHERHGWWRLAPRCTVLNIMGGSELDLCGAELSGRITQLNVYSIMGGGEIRVPDGIHVQVSNFALMGGNDVHLGDEIAPADAPTIRIRLISIMGGCKVLRGRTRGRKERRLNSPHGPRGEIPRADR